MAHTGMFSLHGYVLPFLELELELKWFFIFFQFCGVRSMDYHSQEDLAKFDYK
jgi:hypothetical protein